MLAASPSWHQLLQGLRPHQLAFDEIEQGESTHGWEFFAAKVEEERSVQQCCGHGALRLSKRSSVLNRGPRRDFISARTWTGFASRLLPMVCHCSVVHNWRCLADSAQTMMARHLLRPVDESSAPTVNLLAMDELVWWSSPPRSVGVGLRKPARS